MFQVNPANLLEHEVQTTDLNVAVPDSLEVPVLELIPQRLEAAGQLIETTQPAREQLWTTLPGLALLNKSSQLTSPLEQLTTPPPQLTSTTSLPQQLTFTMSPPKQLTSPPEQLTSPPEQLTSPPQQLTSPPQQIFSTSYSEIEQLLSAGNSGFQYSSIQTDDVREINLNFTEMPAAIPVFAENEDPYLQEEVHIAITELPNITLNGEPYFNEMLENLLTSISTSNEVRMEDIDSLIQTLDTKITKQYQLIGDNIDLLIKTKKMSSQNQNTDIHWFFIYAIVDEILDTSLSNEDPDTKFEDIKLTDFLPNETDQSTLHDTLTILWSRIIVKTIPAFKALEKSVIWHIPHPYQDDMKKKSKVVCKFDVLSYVKKKDSAPFS